MKSYTRCICGRRNEDVPRSILNLFGEQVSAPWCSGVRGCSTYSDSERQDPDLHEYNTRLTPYTLERLDPGIKRYVVECRNNGWLTQFSCDGHGKQDGYISFWDEAHRDAAAALFVDLEVTTQDRRTRIFGMLYELCFPMRQLQQ